ncbi:type II secretion system protein N [Thiohalorhabdus sp. Cl-TMA]|uniref:Type II secretion system protein N n=1 Tax=Thiohalorhabdus methylotrophus TaxID=3242694 RepID=A0ABV4TXK4_9GAMM
MRLLIMGALVYVIALVVQLPASWAFHWARGTVPEAVTWQGVEGTIWHPRINRLAVALPGGIQVPTGPVGVDFQPSALLTGALGARFRAELLGGTVRGRLTGGPGGRWTMSEIQGRLSLSRLADIDPRFGMAGAQGTLLFAGENLAGRALPEKGQLRATLEGLQVGLLPTDGPVGEYALRAEVTGPGRIRGEVQTLEERALGIRGRFRADLRKRTYRFKGEGWVPSDAPQAVQDILPLLGPVRDGRVNIQRQGRLR